MVEKFQEILLINIQEILSLNEDESHFKLNRHVTDKTEDSRRTKSHIWKEEWKKSKKE